MTDAPRTSALDALIARLLQTGDQAVPGGPPPPEELAQARAASAVPMPAELERVYLRADGVYLPHGAALFDTYDFAAVNERAHLFTDLPGAVAFGSDGADRWFIIDTSGVVDGVPGAVYAVDQGVMRPDACVACGRDLLAFLVAVADGALPWEGEMLGERANRRLREALDAHPDRWDGHPSVETDALLAANSALGGLPDGLWELYQRTDGLRIARNGERIARLADVAPVPGARARWVGDGPGGVRYAVTLGVWRDLPEDRLVAVAEGGDPATAPVLGRLADVVASWVEAP